MNRALAKFGTSTYIQFTGIAGNNFKFSVGRREPKEIVLTSDEFKAAYDASQNLSPKNAIRKAIDTGVAHAVLDA